MIASSLLDNSELRAVEHSDFSDYFQYHNYATSLRATSQVSLSTAVATILVMPAIH
ncbi:hypothetical protein ACGLQP_004564 [Vibrio vulnificus]